MAEGHRPSFRASGSPNNGASFLAYQYAGVFRDQKEVDDNKIDYKGVTPGLKPGDMKFKDVDGNGKINGDDQVRRTRRRTLLSTGGVNLRVGWKNFDLSVLSRVRQADCFISGPSRVISATTCSILTIINGR